MMSSTCDQGMSVQAPKAGGELRAARERVGWSLPQMAGALRIRLVHLEALEAGHLQALPGNAYALGFLRTYARALGLDPDETVRRFKAEAAEVTSKTELTFPAPVPERGVPAGALVLLGVVLAVAAYGGWYRLSGEGRLPAETTAPVPERLAPLAEQALPPVVPPSPVAAPAPQIEQPSVAVADAPPAPSISPASAAAAPINPLPPIPPAPAGADQSRILLRANADSWVQVRDKAGPVLLNRILHPGEIWPVPARAGLFLTTGNAGGTELVVDGATTASLGGSGVVRRDLPLDPDSIKDGKLALGAIPTAANPAATPARGSQQ